MADNQANTVNVIDPARSESSSPALRVAVICRSDRIPGDRQNRLKTMGNLICQHLWKRNMDEEMDFIRTDGFPALDGERVGFLLDSGTVLPDTESKNLPILVYRWTGKSMQARQLSNQIQGQIQSLPFKRDRTRLPPGPGKTLLERRSEMPEDEWNALMEHAVYQKFRYRKNISDLEREWAKSHPQLFDQIMRQHISRRKHYAEELWESQRIWLDAHPVGSGDSDSALIHRIIEQFRVDITSKTG